MRKMVEFHHRKCFEMKLGIVLFKSGQEIGEITERQLGVEAAGNVKFSGAFLHCFARHTQTVFNVMRVSIGLSRRAIETTKLAINVANVRRIKMAIYIEV